MLAAADFDQQPAPLPGRGRQAELPRRSSVLLLGNYRPTLTVARTLAEDGFNIVLGLDHDGEGTAQFSRAVHEVWNHPRLDATGGRSFERELRELLAVRPDINVVYPVAEKFVRWCAEHPKALGGRVVASPAPAVVLRCLDKGFMADLAQAADVPCLPFNVVKDLAELGAAAEAVGFPVVVRPLSHLVRLGHKKAIFAADRGELAAALPVWPDGQDGLLVQQFARGRRHDVYFAAQGGEAFRLLEARIARTDCLDGTGLSVEGELAPVAADLAGYVRRLVAKLDYTGIGCAQFLVDPADGSTCFLELNPRVAGSHRCTEWAGMDLTRLAVRLASGEMRLDGEAFSYRPGYTYAWTYGDLGGLKTALSKGEVGVGESLAWLARCAASWLRADFHLTFDLRDPKPTLLGFLRKIPGLQRRALDKPHAHPGRVEPLLGA